MSKQTTITGTNFYGREYPIAVYRWLESGMYRVSWYGGPEILTAPHEFELQLRTLKANQPVRTRQGDEWKVVRCAQAVEDRDDAPADWYNAKA